MDEVLALVGLQDVARRRIGNFSLGMSQRLGIAAALLGDPPTLMFDEPINGLDPEGIVWVRGLFKALAAEGRTVFVSSHLMSEMALTADHLVVIGRGRLIAEGPVEELTARNGGQVRVRSPQADRLVQLLAGRRADVARAADGTLTVRGLDAAAIGEVARGARVALHELTPGHASLEETFFELTNDSVEYRAERAVVPQGA